MSVARAMKSLRLRPRQGPGGAASGVFRYTRPERIEYRFDGAGYTGDGELVLIEEETGPITSLHIYGHLARIGLMALQGDVAKEVAWVVQPRRLKELKRIVRPWYRLGPGFLRVPMPRPVFLSPSGGILGSFE